MQLLQPFPLGISSVGPEIGEKLQAGKAEFAERLGKFAVSCLITSLCVQRKHSTYCLDFLDYFKSQPMRDPMNFCSVNGGAEM